MPNAATPQFTPHGKPIDSEQLVSYQIQSFQVTDRLELEPVADLYREVKGRPEFPSDEPPLVRAKKIPPVLRKARVSIPMRILESMEDVEIAPSTHKLRGKSLAITTHMSGGWVGAAHRSREMRRRERGTGLASAPVYFRSGHAACQRQQRRKNSKTTRKIGVSPAQKGRGVGGIRLDRPSLFLEAHIDFERKQNSYLLNDTREAKKFSIAAREAQFGPLRGDPLSYLPKSKVSPWRKKMQERDDKDARTEAWVDSNGEQKITVPTLSDSDSNSSGGSNKPVLFADDLYSATGAWGVKQGVDFKDFTETTQQLLKGNRVMHKPVLSHMAVM